jgi:hypothetical protein
MNPMLSRETGKIEIGASGRWRSVSGPKGPKRRIAGRFMQAPRLAVASDGRLGVPAAVKPMPARCSARPGLMLSGPLALATLFHLQFPSFTVIL